MPRRTGSTTWTTTACSRTRSSAIRSGWTASSPPGSWRRSGTPSRGRRRRTDQDRHADRVVVRRAGLAPDVEAAGLAAHQEHAVVERLARAARPLLAVRLEPALGHPAARGGAGGGGRPGGVAGGAADHALLPPRAVVALQHPALPVGQQALGVQRLQARGVGYVPLDEAPGPRGEAVDVL